MAGEKPNRFVMKKAGALLSKVDALLTRRNQIIFFVLTVLFVMLSCVNLTTDLFPSQVSTVIYVCAALCFSPAALCGDERSIGYIISYWFHLH